MPTCKFAAKRPTQIALRNEPFRLFFPLGILFSILGVSLWPIFYAKGIAVYPGEAHARLMIEGFVGAFAIGFLGTAFPKMIDAAPLTWVEIGFLLVGALGNVIAHLMQQSILGDAFFLSTWAILLGGLSFRFGGKRHELPPPGFLLAGIGVCAGLVGAAMLILERVSTPSYFEYTFARLLLYEAFPLGPILGIGGFLCQRFFKSETQSPLRQQSWRTQAIVATCVGAALLVSYYAQARGYATLSIFARFLIATLYLLANVAPFRGHDGTGSLSTMLRFALICTLLGILLSHAAPMYRIAVKHLLMIGGYGLLILTIATRVTWGHSGEIERCRGKQKSLRVILIFVLMAMATRMIADWIPNIRVSHHIYAALSWVLAVGVWAWAVLRFVGQTDEARPKNDPTE